MNNLPISKENLARFKLNEPKVLAENKNLSYQESLAKGILDREFVKVVFRHYYKLKSDSKNDL
ncbi:hypothetical protein ACFLSA_01640 [Bacteroidota bacterium]